MKIKTNNYALINGGIVENIMVADETFAQALRGTGDYEAVILSEGTSAYIGGEYINGAFVAQPVEVI